VIDVKRFKSSAVIVMAFIAVVVAAGALTIANPSRSNERVRTGQADPNRNLSTEVPSDAEIADFQSAVADLPIFFPGDCDLRQR
jgi:hypothetical protein